ncbi:putative transcriptional regulator [Latilactobacillus phage TMW 1.1397 P1]|uniref:VRR-NUC domain-containing protein n=1 Tax=Latilactobacillus sakei TaxID=1599 RepID=UPI00203086B2|nr:VRR-NUC domain-containing protein [Latilactobacillus sakei]WAX23883.1 putative transcriptional regulator [Latilactobacillus phage TMW 1.1397 P1]
MSNPETKIQNEIRIALSKHDCTVFRANVGKVMMNNGRWFDTGLPKGHPDLYGFRHSDGKCFYVEVKTKTGRLRDDQKRFAEYVRQFPVLYGVARSAEDAVNIIEGK